MTPPSSAAADRSGPRRSALDCAPDIALAAKLFDALRTQTADPAGGVTRASYGEGEAFAHRLIMREAEALGLDIAHDPARNLYLTLRGRASGKALMVGSHLDSVPCGGNFDGAAGVLMGLAVLAGTDGQASFLHAM